MPDERKLRSRTIEDIIRVVQQRHFNLAGVDHEEWARRLRDRGPDIVKGDREFEAGFRGVLAELKTSHTTFYSERPIAFPPQHTINATLSEIAVNRAPRWMFVDVFEDGPAYNARILPGDLLVAVHGSEPVQGSLPMFGIGRTHMLVGERDQQTIETAVNVPFRKGSKQRPPLVEPVSIRYRLIAPRNRFHQNPVLSWCDRGALGVDLRTAVEHLEMQHCGTLVIDLRGNIGGSLGFAALVSYLCSGREEIGFSLTPPRLHSGYSVEDLPRVPMPRTRLEALARLAAFAVRDKSLMLSTHGLGAQPFHGRAFVLVNESTSSAGEMAAAFASEDGRATLIARTTKGNVLGAMNFQVGDGHWFVCRSSAGSQKTSVAWKVPAWCPEVVVPLTSTEDARQQAKIDHVLRMLRDHAM